MSNLGPYQSMTTVAKKVGGPVKLAALVVAGGYVVIRIGEAGIKKGIKIIKKHKVDNNLEMVRFYQVTTYGESNEGVAFNVGDKFRVLESDGDTILIEKLGDTNNPYFVSANLLRSISDFQ